MIKRRKAVFVSGFDGIDCVLSVVDEINRQGNVLDLYTYNAASVPEFLSEKFESVTEIRQTFYTRIYCDRITKLLDRLNFFKLYLRSIVISHKKFKYEEIHFLGHLNNPSFLIYEKWMSHGNCSVFYYKVPDGDFYKERSIGFDWKLWLLGKLFSRKFAYYDFPPNKVAIGLCENQIKIVKKQSWRSLADRYNFADETLKGSLSESKKILFLGTHFGSFLESVNWELTAQNVSSAINKKFPEHTIFYKPHYRADFDLLMSNMKVFKQNIPAELLLPHFDIVCGFDSSTFKSCNSETRLISCLKLVVYTEGTVEKDMQILANNSGACNYSRMEFLE